MPIFYCALHSSKEAEETDKLHIITLIFTRNPEVCVDQQQPDPSIEDYGLIVESECGLYITVIRVFTV